MDKDTVLVVDDSEIICSIIKDILVTPSLHIEVAHSGEESIQLAKDIHPTLILLDIIMHGIDGYETCRILKNTPETKDIPIIFITGNNDSESVLKGFEVGAADYVSKPFIAEELKARVKVHMHNIKIQRELQCLTKELSILATTDYLTKLYNRRYFMEQLELYANTSQSPISLILFDVDNFKKINDMNGHNAGDSILVTLSGLLKLLLREEDIISRWGGEEIMICLPNTTSEKALSIANKIRNEIARYVYKYENRTLTCTVTGGVIPYNRHLSPERNITFVDQALYSGKSAGKNCCMVKYPS
jgi:two-component system cell cycle response regulator